MPRLVHQRAGQHEPSLHASRQLVGPAVGLVVEPEQCQEFIGAAQRGLSADAVVAGVVHQQLADRQESVDVDLLLGKPEQPPGLPCPVVVTEDRQLPAVGLTMLHTDPISVVLPAPLGPSRPKNAPSRVPGRDRTPR